MKINIKLLLLTAVAGVVAFFIDLALYNALSGTWSQPPLIALMLAVLAVIVCVTLFVLGIVMDQSDEEFFFLEGRGPILVGLAVALLVTFLLGMGLEAIYDSDSQVISTPTSYIFLLDESGSMDGNDPTLERYNAVNTMMQSLGYDAPYAVYMFANEVTCVKPMGLYSQGAFVGDATLGEPLGGGTAIRAGLEGIINDYHGGLLTNAGAAPRVILLSDGFSGDMRLGGGNQVLQKYRAAGITVSCVGIGSDDQNLMKRISGKTGGGYIHIENAQELAQGFTHAASVQSFRDLFSQRDLVSSDVLYGILRVLFLTILGAAIAVMKAAALGNADSHWLIIIEGAIAALVGGLLVELLTLIGVSVGIGILCYCLAVAITPAWMPVKRGEYSNIQINGYY